MESEHAAHGDSTGHQSEMFSMPVSLGETELKRKDGNGVDLEILYISLQG